MINSRSDLIIAEQSRDVTALVAALTTGDPSWRSLAMGALHRLDALTTEQLRSGLTDKDRNVRIRAIEIAIGTSAIDLAPLLNDPDDLVVESAAWAMGEREDSDASGVSALCAIATKHEVSICREAAIAALGAIGSPDGLPAILAGLDDRAPVRRRAVLALAPFDGPEVSAALLKATSDRDRQVRQAAEDLL